MMDEMVEVVETHCTMGLMDVVSREWDLKSTDVGVLVLDTAAAAVSVHLGVISIPKWNDALGNEEGASIVRDALLHTAKKLRNGEL